MLDFVITSESVSSGHPDKMADLISDHILDALLSLDPVARVACETYIKTGLVLVGGEITSNAYVDIESIVRNVIINIGYNSSQLGFDGNTCAVLNAIGKQSPDIDIGVTKKENIEQGAGDQGTMFGYACNETPTYMPLPIMLAHKIMLQQEYVRKFKLNWLRPDGKTQITIQYINNKPAFINNVVLSIQHNPDIAYKDLRTAAIDEILKPILPATLITKDTQFFINPTGKFVIGGPVADCGLTGRKIMVDTYGNVCRHGGGAFSGKDPSKVDRSAAYGARFIAKHIVAANLADKCEVQLSYAIGIAEPTNISINTFGTNKISEAKIIKLIYENFPIKPYELISELDLLKPIYAKTAAFGHFGREDQLFPWENLSKINLLTTK